MVRNCNKHRAVAATHKFFKKAEYEMKGAAMSVDNGRYLICFPVTGTQHIITVGFWSSPNKCLMFEYFLWYALAPTWGFVLYVMSVKKSRSLSGQKDDILAGFLRMLLCYHLKRSWTDVSF